MYHTYINNCYTESQVKAMQDKDSGSRTFEDFISLDDLKYLQGMIQKVDYPEVGKTSKYAGASYHDPQGKILKEIFDEPLKRIIGDYDLDFFAWQEAIKPWKIHADLRWYKDRIPYKVVLIPLDVEGVQDGWPETHTIAFKQRNYLEANKNTNEGKKGNTDQSEWARPQDVPGVKNLCDGYSISREEHEKYFSHMPYHYLEGLEIDNVYKWTPGSCVYWDQNQLHCADNFIKNNIKTKRSLIFFTNQKQN